MKIWRFYLLAFFGGILTILSPCIVPVLPFVFTRADRPFRKSGLPLLVGIALTFVVVAGLTVTGGAWIVRTNQYEIEFSQPDVEAFAFTFG